MEVIPMSLLRAAVANAILEACKGVSDARGRGIIVDLPSEIDFQATVIDYNGWQSLEIRSESVAASEETRSGGESTTRFEDGQSTTQTDERTANGHDQNGETTYEYVDG